MDGMGLLASSSSSRIESSSIMAASSLAWMSAAFILVSRVICCCFCWASRVNCCFHWATKVSCCWVFEGDFVGLQLCLVLLCLLLNLHDNHIYLCLPVLSGLLGHSGHMALWISWGDCLGFLQGPLLEGGKVLLEVLEINMHNTKESQWSLSVMHANLGASICLLGDKSKFSAKAFASLFMECSASCSAFLYIAKLK